MRLGSVCSGCGCIDLGLERAGFEPAWQVEINPKRRSVLARHWPTVRRYSDLREVAQNAADLDSVDLLAGGTPCQDWSVAGNRAGLDGERANLFVDFIRLADHAAIPWLLWENVPGVLSQHGGQDFAVCLEGFTGARPAVPAGGWRSAGVAWGPLRWCAWRVLDAQAFGVPQQRRRVFVVSGVGARPSAEVLFEPESPEWSPPTRRDGIASSLTRKGPNNGQDLAVNLVDGERFFSVTEGERLQGLPDDHTRYGSDGRELADTPRYQMIGDGAAVPVLEWIGRRLRPAMEGRQVDAETAAAR